MTPCEPLPVEPGQHRKITGSLIEDDALGVASWSLILGIDARSQKCNVLLPEANWIQLRAVQWL